MNDAKVGFDAKVQKAIPAEFNMISVSQSSPSDVHHDREDPLVAAYGGGPCTEALLDVLYMDRKVPKHDISWAEVLHQMHLALIDMGHDQYVPMLSSSRMINVEKPLCVAPPKSTGTRRAVLIGINYNHHTGRQPCGSHIDVRNVHEYLTRGRGFEDCNIIILMDDGVNNAPTRKNILSAFRRVVRQSRTGDVVFCHYAGRCCELKNTETKEDGIRKTLVPVDYKISGLIQHRDLFEDFVCAMSAGVKVTFVTDCFSGGAVVDLPYQLSMEDNETHGKLYRNDGFNLSTIVGLTLFAGAAAGVAVAATDNKADNTGETTEALSRNNANDESDCCGFSYFFNECCACCEGLFEDCP